MDRRAWLAGMLLASTGRAARAQAGAFPARPIRILVPFASGSGSDSGARVYGEILSKMIGQPVVVENRPGASGLLAIQALKAAPADGCTMLIASNSPLTVNPVVIRNLPYDPFKDFRPVIGLGRGAVALAVRGDVPYRSIQDLVGAAKKDRRPLNVGNYSAGYQLIASWLGTASGAGITHVAYKGGAQMLNDLIAGQLDLAAIDFGGTLHLLRDNRVRVLAITDDRRHPAYPDIPTMKESGFADFVSWVWTALYVRAETPDDITAKLSDLMQQLMVSDKARAYHATLTSEVMSLKPEDMRRFQQAEYERFRRVAEAAGIQPQ